MLSYGEGYMITIILESKTVDRIAKVSQLNNEVYLLQNKSDYKILSELSTVDYDAFAREDMKQLIIELEMLKEDLYDEKDLHHINEIIELADKCISIPDSYLIFTPF